jgi:hypothetical protein
MDEFENAETVSNIHAKKKDEEKEVRAHYPTHIMAASCENTGTYPGRRNVN